MDRSGSLPLRPSLDSLRKQAKQLARAVGAGDADALERARRHIASAAPPLTQRQAQLVIAREYGFPGWQDLVSEVEKRLGTSLAAAVAQARRAIHDHDLEALKRLVSGRPALLSWYDEHDDGGLVGMAAGAYADSFDASREEYFTRRACAEWLIDAGAVARLSVFDGVLRSRARGLLQLFHRKGLLPPTLKFQAALGDEDGVREQLREDARDLTTVSDAFAVACNFHHDAIASLLLDRAAALDPHLAPHIDDFGRAAFVKYFIEHRPSRTAELGPWRALVAEQAKRAVSSWSGGETSVTSPAGESDLSGFVRLLQANSWLLGDEAVDLQSEIIERATLKDRPEFIRALFELHPAILQRQPPPPSQAAEFAFTYAKTHLLPLLTRIWRLPDDLPHAAGVGDLARVAKWFDESGRPILGDLVNHYPFSADVSAARAAEYARQFGPPSVQRVLDVALAWAVINRHLNIAGFLLAHGADINTRWSSHEPASILHELVFHGNYEAMQFLIDRGIDLTIKDYRWNSTAQGWARHAARDEAMARWLEEAERRRQTTSPAP